MGCPFGVAVLIMRPYYLGSMLGPLIFWKRPNVLVFRA